MTQAEFADRIVAMQGTLYRVSTGILPALHDREDAVQACVEKAWRSQGKLRDDTAMQAWVIRILINECYGLLRKRRHEVPTDVLPDVVSTEREVLADANPDLYQLFTALPDKYRLPMLLHYVEDYPVREVAVILRLPAGTVKTRLMRGRAALKKIIAAEEALA